MGNAIEIIIGIPLVSLSGAYIGGWLAMVSFVIQDRMGPEDRYLIRSLKFRSMIIGLIISVIIILQEYHVNFPSALGFKNCVNVFLLAMAISGIYGSLFLFLRLRKRFRVRSLANRAFFLVEQHDFDSAIELLKHAISVDPTYGHAYNELAYIYGKSGQFDLGEEFALRAINCDPKNPKFYNALIGILLDRAKILKTRSEVAKSVGEQLKQIDDAIKKQPDYPPFYLSKAAILALSGKSQEVWGSELITAQKLYSGRSYAASGLPLQPGDIDTIIAQNKSVCLEMAQYWQHLS